MSQTVDILNVLGDVPKDLVEKVEAYFGNQQSPVPSTVTDLNKLIGYSYRLKIDWRERIPPF
jgi:hypothetical protein